MEFAGPLFDEIDDSALQSDSVQGVDLLYSRRAGDIDLREIVADDIQPDKIETQFHQVGRQEPADLPIPRRQICFDGLSANMEIAPVFIVPRDAQESSQGLAVKNHDALIALSHLRNIALRHDESPPVGRGHFQESVNVSVFTTEIENPTATEAVQRLDHHLSTQLLHEAPELSAFAADKSLGDDLRKVQGVKLLVGLAQSARMVHHEASALIHQAQEMRGKEKLHVEGRILAHENYVETAQGLAAFLAKTIVGISPRHADAAKAALRRRAADREVIKLHIGERVASLLRLKHQDEGGVLVDVDLINGVHDDPDLQGSHRFTRLGRALSYDPGAGHQIVPSPFLPVPENAQKTHEQRRDRQGADPADQGLTVSDGLLAGADDAEAKQPFSNGSPFQAMKQNKVTADKKDPCNRENSEKRRHRLPGERTLMSRQTHTIRHRGQINEQQGEKKQDQSIDHKGASAPEKTCPSHRASLFFPFESLVKLIELSINQRL